MKNEQLLKDFIKYFKKDKYKFEKFCKIFLKWLDFDDVQVTKRNGDGGIDLKCCKREIEQLELHTIDYVVQAKCKKHSNKVTPHDIRDFRGSKTSMAVRKIFITTGNYTKAARAEAADSNQPIILIDGDQLINFCKTLNDTMFDVEYYFNKQKLDDIFTEAETITAEQSVNVIEKRITKNDVRARILRIPSEYKEILKNYKSFDLSINGQKPKKYNISADKVYFGGVTEIYRNFLSNIDFDEGQSIWKYDQEKNLLFVTIK